MIRFSILVLFITLIPIRNNSQVAAPIYRDPITDGAADPCLIYNSLEEAWWMLYTQRRANVESADVAYCYGNEIAIQKIMAKHGDIEEH